MAFRLTAGIKEAHGAKRYTYDSDLLGSKGPYAGALEALTPMLKRCWPNDFRSKQLRHEVALHLVHECERAKAWVHLCRSSGEDFPSADLKHREEMRDACIRAVNAIEQLMRCDTTAAYHLRTAFAAGLCSVVPAPSDLDYVRPDQNRDDGGLHVKLDGEIRHEVEMQFSMRATLGDLDLILSATQSRLNLWTKKVEKPWFQVGNLRFEPPLSKKARAAIKKGDDQILGAAILGLAASLSNRFRDFSVGRRQRWVGEELSTQGKPFWLHVTDFVNAAFDLREPETEESLRQKVRTACQGRRVRLMGWPEAPVREPQVQKT